MSASHQPGKAGSMPLNGPKHPPKQRSRDSQGRCSLIRKTSISPTMSTKSYTIPLSRSCLSVIHHFADESAALSFPNYGILSSKATRGSIFFTTRSLMDCPGSIKMSIYSHGDTRDCSIRSQFPSGSKPCQATPVAARAVSATCFIRTTPLRSKSQPQ
jgi:hypothetical protein